MLSAIVLSTLLSLSMAQTTTVAIPFIGYDEMPIVASGVGANADAVTLQLACAPGTDGNDCGLFPKQTLVVGPSTYNMDMSDPNSDFTATQDCVVGTAEIVCKETAGGSEANFPGSSTETYAITDVGLLSVTITAGLEKLSALAIETASGVATASGASPTPVSRSGSVSQTGSPSASGSASTLASVAPSGSASGSSTGSQTSSAPATVSTAAAPANIVALGGGLLGAAAGVLGGLLL